MKHCWSLLSVKRSAWKTRVTQDHRGAVGPSAVCWAYCPVWCRGTGSILLWTSGRGDFSLGVNMGSDSIPPKLFSMRVQTRSSLCTHALHSTDSDIHILNGWMPATKTPSVHHPWRWNVTTSMVGFKNGHIHENLTQNDEPQRYSWERRMRREVNPRDIVGNAEEEEEESFAIRLVL